MEDCSQGSVYPFEYRAALALNNMAVAMMERSCCEQAFETFRDATVVMKQAFRDDNTSEPRTDHQGRHLAMQSIHTKLEQAYRRAAKPIPSKKTFNIRVLSDEANFDMALLAPLTQPQRDTQSRQDAFHALIRINTDEHLQPTEKSVVDLITTIILFNLAVVSLCHPRNDVKRSSAKKRRADAISILNVCRELLTSLYYDHAENPILRRTISVLTTVVLYELVQALHASERSQEAHAAADALVELIWVTDTTSSHDDETLNLLFDAEHQVAPAA